MLVQSVAPVSSETVTVLPMGAVPEMCTSGKCTLEPSTGEVIVGAARSGSVVTDTACETTDVLPAGSVAMTVPEGYRGQELKLW